MAQDNSFLRGKPMAEAVLKDAVGKVISILNQHKKRRKP